MVSKFQWKPFWLATQRDPQNDWTATQNRGTMTYSHRPHCNFWLVISRWKLGVPYDRDQSHCESLFSWLLRRELPLWFLLCSRWGILPHSKPRELKVGVGHLLSSSESFGITWAKCYRGLSSGIKQKKHRTWEYESFWQNVQKESNDTNAFVGGSRAQGLPKPPRNGSFGRFPMNEVVFEGRTCVAGHFKTSCQCQKAHTLVTGKTREQKDERKEESSTSCNRERDTVGIFARSQTSSSLPVPAVQQFTA